MQRSLLVRYHVDDPVDFFQSSGFWKVPNDPTVSEAVQAPQPPYYLQVKLPGQETSNFELTSVLTGFQREFMSAYFSASSDPDNYGKLTVLRLPTSTQTPGPAQVQQLFRTTQEISSLVTLSTQQNGSRVIFGNLLTLPVNDGLLYVEPFYIQGQASSTSSFPQLNRVLVWYAGRVGSRRDPRPGAHQGRRERARAGADGRGRWRTSAADDRRRLCARGRDGDVGATGTGTSPPPADEAAALVAMDEAAQALDAAKASGDLAAIGAASQQLENAVNDFLTLRGQSLNGANGGEAVPTTPAPTSGGG